MSSRIPARRVRQLDSPLDRALAELDHALRTTLAPPDAADPYPAAAVEAPPLDPHAAAHAAGLMRVNHAGEVAAQALYRGQATTARDPATRAQLLEAATEEGAHLAWCDARLDELGARPSVFGPVWYAASFALGAIAGLAGDRVSLGFVAETEKQVETHLGDHLARLPAEDARSRAVVTAMQADEARHGENARAAGGVELPAPVPRLMEAVADLMRFVAYRI